MPHFCDGGRWAAHHWNGHPARSNNATFGKLRPNHRRVTPRSLGLGRSFRKVSNFKFLACISVQSAIRNLLSGSRETSILHRELHLLEAAEVVMLHRETSFCVSQCVLLLHSQTHFADIRVRYFFTPTSTKCTAASKYMFWLVRCSNTACRTTFLDCRVQFWKLGRYARMSTPHASGLE